jgi:hypothetical protein
MAYPWGRRFRGGEANGFSLRLFSRTFDPFSAPGWFPLQPLPCVLGERIDRGGSVSGGHC